MSKQYFGCQQNLIESTPVLEFICSQANKLTNQGIWLMRQTYFKTGKYLSKYDLQGAYKDSKHFQAMYSQAGQGVLHSVFESFKSYKELSKLWRQGKLEHRPKLPNYRTKDGLAVVSYPKQALKLSGNQIRVPLGQLVKTWFGIDSFTVQMPSNLEFDKIKELRLLPRNQAFYAEFVYGLDKLEVSLDSDRALGIDPGMNNWLTCVSNFGDSFIIDGLHLKSLNQWYNKRVSALKEGKSQNFWSNMLARTTEKRNRQMRDAVNKAARFVVNYCLANRVGTVVFGWNKGQKKGANLGSKTNQKFVQIPTARLKERISQLCEQFGIQFVETEESYTSKASFLDSDVLPVFGAKPEGWKESGKRVKRGLYQSAKGIRINADCNGAANILRKVAMTLSIDLEGISRGALTSPSRVRLWTI